MLQKCVDSGRYGVLASPAWKAKQRPNTGVHELPRELQEWWENEGVESRPESMLSDAEWEGWRRELELEGPPRPNSPEPSFVTESDGLLRRRQNHTPVSGRGKTLEEIVKWTSPAARRPSPPSNSAPTSPRPSLSVLNHARSATVATSSVTPRPSSHCTHGANYDLATLLPKPPDAPEDGQLPGLGGGLGTSYRPYHTHTVTTISALRSADNETAPKKSMERVRSNKGKRRDETEDNPTSEEVTLESPSLAVDHRNNTWTRSHNEGLDRLRHMSSSGLRQPGSKGGLLKNFSLRDR
jgi:hypothetical protein